MGSISKKIHKDGQIKQVPVSELDSYLIAGWQLGTGKPVWNKGLTKSDPRVAKYAEKCIGRSPSIETRHKLSLINRGKKWKPESIAKRTASRGGFVPSEEQRIKVSNKLKGHLVSDETRKKISIRNKGKGHPCSDATKRKVSTHNSSREFQEHQRKVKHANNSFNTSNPEERAALKLNTMFPGKVRRHYSSQVYPYECDFYIEDFNMYIELNYHWTHGKHPYNPLSQSDQRILDNAKLKAGTYINSKGLTVKNFYQVFIEVWTRRDVEKLNCARNNNLNYQIFYTEKEFNDWVSTFEK